MCTRTHQRSKGEPGDSAVKHKEISESRRSYQWGWLQEGRGGGRRRTAIEKDVTWSACTLLLGMWTGTAAVETVWQFLKNVKIELPCDPAIPYLDICPKELKSGTWTALFTVARRWKPPKCPLREGWINKMCYMHTMEYYYSVLERKENSDTCCNMVKPWGQYGQWNMPVTKKRQILYDSTHMRYLLLLLSRFSRVQLCVTPEMAAHHAPPSLGFSRQEHRSGLPFPPPMHESEKWKWSRSVVSNSEWPHGLQPTRLLHPWDFPGKSTGVGAIAFSNEVPRVV